MNPFTIFIRPVKSAVAHHVRNTWCFRNSTMMLLLKSVGRNWYYIMCKTYFIELIAVSSTTHGARAWWSGGIFKGFPDPITVDPIKPQRYCYEGFAFVMNSATSPVARWHSMGALWFYADIAVTGHSFADNVLIRCTVHRKRVTARRRRRSEITKTSSRSNRLVPKTKDIK